MILLSTWRVGTMVTRRLVTSCRIPHIHGTVLLRRRVQAAVVQTVVAAAAVVVVKRETMMTSNVQTHATIQVLSKIKEMGQILATSGVEAKVAHGQTTVIATIRSPRLRRKRAAAKPFVALEKHVLRPL